MTYSQKKCELRKRLNVLAQELPIDDGGIAKKVLALPQWSNASTIFCYVAFGYEPATMPILNAAFSANKRVCVPFCIGNGIMKALIINSIEELHLGKFDILTPHNDATEICPKEIDFAVVPCLAADISGNRIGKGGGYYDRFLPLCRDDCYKVLLCRRELIQTSIPLEPHDIKTDLVVYA